MRALNKKKLAYLIISGLLLYFVLLDEAADTFLTNTSSKILELKPNKYFEESTIVYLLLGLQIIFSPLQAGFSDFYLRRKSLFVSFSCTFLAIIFLQISMSYGIAFLLLAILLKGVLGNTLPIAWAGIADVTSSNNIRFALALSICAVAIGSWGSLLFLPHISTQTFFLIILCALISGIIFVIYPFKDPEDSPKPHFLEAISIPRMLKHECISIFHIAKKPLNLITLICFLFSEISFYQILFRLEVFHHYNCLIHVPLAIGIGYTAGTICLKFIKAKDKDVSLTGLWVSVLSITTINIFFLLEYAHHLHFTIFFAIYSFGYALFTPALFSLITPREHPHLQGKIYGVLESTDSLASLITFLILFNSEKIACDRVVLMSTIAILISSSLFYFVHKKAPVAH